MAINTIDISNISLDDLEGYFYHFSPSKYLEETEINGIKSRIGRNSQGIDTHESIFFSIGVDGVLELWDVWLKYKMEILNNPLGNTWSEINRNMQDYYNGNLSVDLITKYEKWRQYYDQKKFLHEEQENEQILSKLFDCEYKELKDAIYYALDLIQNVDFVYEQTDLKKLAAIENAKNRNGIINPRTKVMYGDYSDFSTPYVDKWNMQTIPGKEIVIEPERIHRLTVNGNDNAYAVLEWVYDKYKKEVPKDKQAKFDLLDKFIEYVKISNINKKVDEVLEHYYDDLELARKYLIMGNEFVNKNGINMDELLQEFNPRKGMYPLETKITKHQVMELAIDFFNAISPEYSNYFINDIQLNRGNISFSNNPYSHVSFDGQSHHVDLTDFGDLRDLYTIVHEYTHLFDSQNGINETRNILTETNAQCMERCLDSYLLSLNDTELDRYGIDRKILMSDINKRKTATFFTRLKETEMIKDVDFITKAKKSAYMLAQIYSTFFSNLSFEEQKNNINNMISGTKNNNIQLVLNYLPCNLSRENEERDSIIESSISNVYYQDYEQIKKNK